MKSEKKYKSGWTNNVLVEEYDEKIIYYLPCYLRLKVKNFISISLESLSGSFNSVLVFSVYYGYLPNDIVE